MKITKTLPLALILACVSYSSVSEADLRRFSRANCFMLPLDIGNESISWDPTTKKRYLQTISSHYVRGVFRHKLDTGWEITSWSHANHREISSQAWWYVEGRHYRKAAGITYLKKTSATDCNLSQF